MSSASAASAPVLACLFGVTIFVGRLSLPIVLRAVNGRGHALLPGAQQWCGRHVLRRQSWLKVVGLVRAGIGGAPLYPLTDDAFYRTAGDPLDSVTLGAYSALAAGVAVTLGPLALGVLADSIRLRRAILIVPVLSLLGAVTQRPRATACYGVAT